MSFKKKEVKPVGPVQMKIYQNNTYYRKDLKAGYCSTGDNAIRMITTGVYFTA